MAYLRLLEREREAIAAEFGDALEWLPNEGKKERHVAIERRADVEKRENWPALHSWMQDVVERMVGVFRNRVRTLEIDENNDDG